MSSLALKIPPPLVALVVALLMGLAAAVTGAMDIAQAYRLCAAIALALAGTGVRLVAQLTFRRAGTTVNPLDPGQASAMVCTGLYRHTRNPMYLGRALQLLGWGAFLASPLALLLVPLYLAYVDRFQVPAEERALRQRFGSAYEAYQLEVPRWL